MPRKNEHPAPLYRRQTHLNSVLRASAARYTGWAILEALCRLSEFERPEVTITKDQLEREARRTLKCIKRGLQELRDEGTIVPVKNFAGGRGNAVTYRLCIAKGARAAEDARAAAPAPAEGPWGAILEAVAREIGDNGFRTWLAPLEFAGLTDGELRLLAPSKFVASHVSQNHAERLLAAAQEIAPETRRVRVEAA